MSKITFKKLKSFIAEEVASQATNSLNEMRDHFIWRKTQATHVLALVLRRQFDHDSVIEYIEEHKEDFINKLFDNYDTSNSGVVFFEFDNIPSKTLLIEVKEFIGNHFNNVRNLKIPYTLYYRGTLLIDTI